MTEALFHLVWAERRFRTGFLSTTDGATVEVAHTGGLYSGDGPDFRDARVRLDGLLLAGEVELHLRCRDWRAHGHSSDPAYNGVILHVVLHPEGAGPVPRHDGTWCPTLVLRPHVDARISDLLNQSARRGRLACHGMLADVPSDAIDRQFRHAEQHYFDRKQADLLDLRPPDPDTEESWRLLVGKGLFDGLGIRHNRHAMRDLFDRAVDRAAGWTSAAEADLDMHILAFRSDPPIRWDWSGSRPDNQPERRVRQGSMLIWRLATVTPRLDAFIPFTHGLGLGAERRDLLFRNVWLPGLALYAQWRNDPEQLAVVVRAWHARDRAVPSAVSAPFMDAGFPAGIVTRSAGVPWQLRERCRASACDRCAVMASLIRS
jgi:hypothetical protein